MKASPRSSPGVLVWKKKKRPFSGRGIVDKNLKPKQMIYLVGLVQTLKEENGMREARSILTKYSPDRSWYRFVDDFKAINEKLVTLRPRDWLDQVEAQLKNYRPLRVHS